MIPIYHVSNEYSSIDSFTNIIPVIIVLNCDKNSFL